MKREEMINEIVTYQGGIYRKPFPTNYGILRNKTDEELKQLIELVKKDVLNLNKKVKNNWVKQIAGVEDER